MSGVLAGDVAVITGAAGGIGSATAQLLAHHGARVVASDIDLDGAADVARRIVDDGGAAVAVRCDMGVEAEIRQLFGAAVDAFGGVGILFNNAAAIGPHDRGPDGTVEDQDVGRWDHVMAVNLRGPMIACKLAIPLLRARGGGSIVNTLSPAGWLAEPEQAAYGASKAGLTLLTRHVASGFGHEGIRCNGIAPGLVVGPHTETSVAPGFLAARRRHTRSTRLGRPEDIAHTVLFLVSPAAAYVNGAVIPVDGAYTAHNAFYADHLELLGRAHTGGPA